jgi:hypothetical protein
MERQTSASFILESISLLIFPQQPFLSMKGLRATSRPMDLIGKKHQSLKNRLIPRSGFGSLIADSRMSQVKRIISLGAISSITTTRTPSAVRRI